MADICLLEGLGNGVFDATRDIWSGADLDRAEDTTVWLIGLGGVFQRGLTSLNLGRHIVLGESNTHQE